MFRKGSLLAVKDEVICLDYTELLASSCKKSWSFADAVYGVMPIFGLVTRSPANLRRPSGELFKELALQIISTQVNDEVNIVRLITLAAQYQVKQLKVLLPYALTEQQLENIQQQYRKPLNLSQQDEHLIIQRPEAATS